MILNDGVEDTVCFHTDYRTRTAFINAIGYAFWKDNLKLVVEIHDDITPKGLEVHTIITDYLSTQKDKYMYVQHHT